METNGTKKLMEQTVTTEFSYSWKFLRIKNFANEQNLEFHNNKTSRMHLDYGVIAFHSHHPPSREQAPTMVKEDGNLSEVTLSVGTFRVELLGKLSHARMSLVNIQDHYALAVPYILLVVAMANVELLLS